MGNESSTSKELTKLEKNPDNHENGSVKGISVNITSNALEIDANGETDVQKNGGPPSLNLSTESTDPGFVVIETDGQHVDGPVISEILEAPVQKEEVKKSKEEKVPLFSKMFKKKTEPPAEVKSVEKPETSNTDQTDVSVPASDPEPDTANQKQESEPLAKPESVTLEPEPQEEKGPETDNGDSQHQEDSIPEDSIPEENPVMNFFKTLVTPTKTTKKETATPDATKDQSQKEKQPAATTTVAQVSEPPAAPKGMTVPPPPPPEPPKLVITAEAAAKSPKPTPKEEPKAAAKEPESSKGKSAKITLNKFFRPKKMKEEPQPAVEVEAQPVVEVQEVPAEELIPVVDVQSEKSLEAQETAEEAQPVVEEQLVEEVPQPVVEDEKVDPSKTGTLEAAPKPEPPPPVQEEKKTSSKSAFLSLFKPKAADPNKAAPAPAAAAEAAQTAKAKEEPKAAAKSPEVVVFNRPASEASQAADDAANAPKKLEKRNSVQKFFKILGQRRSSTDAGVQTEPVTVAPAAEKAK